MKAKIVKDEISFGKTLKLTPENNKEKLELLSIFNDDESKFEAVISLKNKKLKNILIYNTGEV